MLRNDRELRLKKGLLEYWTPKAPITLKGTILLSKIRSVGTVDRGRSLLGEPFCFDITEVSIYRVGRCREI